MGDAAPASVPPPVVVVTDERQGHGCLTQFVWFLFVGSWLSQVALLVSYLLILTVVLLPLGFKLINKVPYLATLRSPRRQTTVTQDGGAVHVHSGPQAQRPLWQRALYFVLIGFWFGFLVVEAAWLLTATVLLAPLGLSLFGWAPTAISLRR